MFLSLYLQLHFLQIKMNYVMFILLFLCFVFFCGLNVLYALGETHSVMLA